MGEIFKFIVDNFNHLKAIDFFFMFILITLSSLGIFYVLKWIYGALIKSQKQLIDIKDDLIASYQSHLEQISSETKTIVLKYEELNYQFNTLAMQHVQALEDKDAINKAFKSLYSNALTMRVILLSIKRAYVVLSLYICARKLHYIYARRIFPRKS